MHMKKYMFIFTIFLALASCEYDNYKGPDCLLTGKVTYNGKPFVFDSNVSALKACQWGFGKEDGGQTIRIKEDGTFSQLFFPGDYKLTISNHQFPFCFPQFPSLGNGLGYDSLQITLNSDKQMDFEIVPYYVFDTVYFEPLDENSTELKVTAKISRVHDERITTEVPMVQRAYIYAGINQFVNSATTLTKGSRPLKIDESEEVTIRLDLTKYYEPTFYVNNYRNYLYFRVGIELAAPCTGYYLFSDLYRVDNIPMEKLRKK